VDLVLGFLAFVESQFVLVTLNGGHEAVDKYGGAHKENGSDGEK
jgi:hypothetical protein